ncbi:MAG TPA: hypothetical protein VEG29_04145, partial [Candidatus Binatia bacterium]|nr:hypothetical protein [Candidatus Binatia bacterium]
MTDPTFDPRLADLLGGYADRAVRDFDPVVIAEAAIATPRRVIGIRPRLTLLVAATLVVGGTIGLAAYVGSRPLVTPRQSPGPATPAVVEQSASPSSDAIVWTDGVAPQQYWLPVGVASVWRTDLVNGTSTKLLVSVQDPTISPDGTHVAYLATDGIHLVSTEGDSAVVLARTLPAASPCDPAVGACPDGTLSWSPDGRWLGWTECAADDSCRMHISSADGSVQLSPTSPALTVRDVDWWWSGDQVEFDSSSGYSVMDLPGIKQRSLAGRTYFSPDGTLLASATATRLTISTAAGAELGHADFPADRNILPPQWSPADDSIAVQVGWSYDRFLSPLTFVGRTGEATTARLQGEQTAEGSLIWAPDGSRVFVRGGGGSPTAADGLIIGRDGSVVAHLGDLTVVAWSPDGSHLAVFDPITAAIVVVNAQGHQQQLV